MKYYKMDRHVSAVSDGELERRWKATREYMAANDIDCLILFGFEPRQGGVIRYYCDWPADFCHYGSFLLFPKEGGMALFAHGPFQNNAMPYGARGLELNFGAPYTSNWLACKDYFTEPALAWLKKRGYKKFGIYHPSMAPLYFTDCIIGGLPGAVLQNADEGVDLIRARKSPEELELLRHVVKMHDLAYAAVPIYLRPGRPERDVAADIKKACWDLGGEAMNIMIGSGPQKAQHKFFELQNRVLLEGDTVDLLIEINGPGSYWGELSRMWVVGGEASAELEKGVADSVSIQAQLAAMAKPGVKAADLRKALHKFEEANGYIKEGRFFGHGQGTDMVERPAYQPEETMILEENMFLSIHPGLETETCWSFNTDNYLVTPDGAVRLNKTEQGIFRI
ncbi:MAG: M24 family metallopeptidase [Gracilibacteraceae bacterium]|jgi:Xaa-Pro aminopeptidase|nr:M24 family metallopeptidase [Gracilibacteraceae bacterium]